METKELEVFATDSNYAVIKPPGRSYPGCVIQGDTLANLCRTAKRIADFAHAQKIDDEDVLNDIQELNNALVGRILHYQDVLSLHGIEFPHIYPFSKVGLVKLQPDDDEPVG
jgi:predicted RNase H-like HicB family nuclease